MEMAAQLRGHLAVTTEAYGLSRAASPYRWNTTPAWSCDWALSVGDDLMCHGADARAAGMERIAVSHHGPRALPQRGKRWGESL
jgi:hypothetical protein